MEARQKPTVVIVGMMVKVVVESLACNLILNSSVVAGEIPKNTVKLYSMLGGEPSIDTSNNASVGLIFLVAKGFILHVLVDLMSWNRDNFLF